MQCCVAFCKNTSDDVSPSARKGISFHGFPSDMRLRAAWLGALGKQDSHLPDSAVVCSQHFLADDIYETESGLKQIVTGAIPSNVQVCMICLDTDSKMFLMSKQKLDEAYKNLTGQPLCDQGNLRQTVCVQCAQRLINFNQFRDKSLRARALMMDLVEKHKFITRQHVKMINRTKYHLKSNFVVTMLGPDPCDLYIQEDPSEDKQTESEATEHRVVVKNENYDSKSVDDEMVANEDNNSVDNVNDESFANKEEYFIDDNEMLESELTAETQDPLKCESAPFQCTLCSEEFVCELAYMQHMSMHIQKGDGDCGMSQVCKPHTAVSSSSSHSSLLTENRQANQKLNDEPHLSADSALTSVAPSSGEVMPNNENKVQAESADKIQKSKQIKRNKGIMQANINMQERMRIVQLHNLGYNISQICNETGFTWITVKRWVSRHKEEGNLTDKPRSGRPRHINASQRRSMVEQYENNGFIPTVKFANMFDTSTCTVRRVLHSEGLHHRKPTRKPSNRN